MIVNGKDHLDETWWRSKGGRVSQERRRKNPKLYKSLGCIVANEFSTPPKTKLLSEFIGIALGDGCLTKYQLHITLNSEVDREYAIYVKELIEKLFSYSPSVIKRRGCKAVMVIVTGVKFVKILLNMGMVVGNKVKKQVCVPEWIINDLSFSKNCLKGLIDTDGGVFTHNYFVKERKYSYLKLCFSNMSQPLRIFAFNTLGRCGLNPKLQGKKHVWLYSQRETKKYVDIIGSSNDRVLRKFR